MKLSLIIYWMGLKKETPDLGKTMWAGYNALTHWATHTDETIEVLNDKNQMVKIRSGKSTADKPSVQKEQEMMK